MECSQIYWTRRFFLDSGQARELLDIYHQGDYTNVRGEDIRDVEEIAGATDLHVQAIVEALGPLPKCDRRFRVVLDACNGAGSIIGPKLIETLGAEVIPINAVPDGSFPRPAEPLPENLSALRAAVKEHHADVGFAQDMDADRLAIVSDKGEPIGEDYTLILATSYILGKEKGPVAANLATSRALQAVVGRFGCAFFQTRIGEVNVTETMEREHAVIGGEGNGGVIYPRINFARDSLVGVALVLHYLAETGKSVSQLMADIPRFSMIKEKLQCPSHRLPGLLRMIRDEYKTNLMDTRDGVKVILPNGWFLVRGSNTEPIVRVIVEAETDSAAGELIGMVFDRVRQAIGS
jgi:phosphomannomutase